MKRNKMSRFSAPRRGFTFLEIMMVVVIIGILASLIIPQFGGRTRRAKVTLAKSDMKTIETALGGYEMEVGDYPSSDQGLKALVERPSDVPEEDWSQQLKEVPLDPWKNEYTYKKPGDHGAFDLVSMGPDGKPNTDDDIGNWTKAKKN